MGYRIEERLGPRCCGYGGFRLSGAGFVDMGLAIQGSNCFGVGGTHFLSSDGDRQALGQFQAEWV